MIRVARNGNIIGEYAEADISTLVKTKVILETDDYWTAGMQGWAKVSQLLSNPSLKPQEAIPTPPPPQNNLIKCPDCQREVSKLALTCPGCGRPLSEAPTPAKQEPIKVVTTENSFWTRNRGTGDLILFGPFALIIFFVIFGSLRNCHGG
jgi:hypothetical protein